MVMMRQLIIYSDNSKNNYRTPSQQLTHTMQAPAKTPFASTLNQHPKAPLEKQLPTEDSPSPMAQAFVPNPFPMVRSDCRTHFKIAFSKYSRIHFCYKLHSSTLFRAISLYIHCLHSFLTNKTAFSYDYLTLACLFLSMKYEEVYPPRLHHLASFFKCHIDLTNYKFTEKQVLTLLDGDLDIQTPQRILDQHLYAQAEDVYSFAYYLLEMSLIDTLMPTTFSTQEICLAIFYILSQVLKITPPRPQMDAEFTKNVKICAKLIVTAKDRLRAHEAEYVHRKYSKEQAGRRQPLGHS